MQFFKENGSYQTCSSIQGTQITVESVFISRFPMNNIAPNLQKCWTHKIAFKIISEMLKQPNFFQSQSKGSTCKVLPFSNFWFKLYDKFCSPPCRNFDRDARPIFLGLKFGQILFFWVGKFFSYFSGSNKFPAIFFNLPIFVSHT